MYSGAVGKEEFRGEGLGEMGPDLLERRGRWRHKSRPGEGRDGVNFHTLVLVRKAFRNRDKIWLIEGSCTNSYCYFQIIVLLKLLSLLLRAFFTRTILIGTKIGHLHCQRFENCSSSGAPRTMKRKRVFPVLTTRFVRSLISMRLNSNSFLIILGFRSYSSGFFSFFEKHR